MRAKSSITDALSAVGDFNGDLTAVGLRIPADLKGATVFTHRVCRIGEEVDEDLRQLTRHAAHQ